MESNGVRVPVTFTDRLRSWFKWVVDPLGKFFLSLGMTPNMMTTFGLLGNFLGAYFPAYYISGRPSGNICDIPSVGFAVPVSYVTLSIYTIDHFTDFTSESFAPI